MSDKPVDKSVDKTVVVLCRLEPLAGRFQDAKKVSEEWFEFIKKMPDCKRVDIICSVEHQIAWLEDWTSKMALDKFMMDHLVYADFSVRMLDCSRGVPFRHVYRKLQ
jgi:hypothetical protein